MAIEGGLCDVCFSGTLILHSGLLTCEVCGNVAQDFIEETQEFQAGVSDAKFFRKEKRGSIQGEAVPVKEKERPDAKGGVPAYAKAVQHLLQKQVAALCHTFGASAVVKDVAFEIWTAYLASSRILEPSFVTALEAKIEVRQAEMQYGPSFSEYSVARMAIAAELRRILPVSITLAICFLACWHVKEAINPLDITKAALDAQLPYLEFANDSRELLEPFTTVLARNLVIPSGVPGPGNLYFRALETATAIGMRCPSVNSSLCIHRFIDEMQLPEPLFPVALTLHNLYGAGFHEKLKLQTNSPLHPWAILMAFVILAAKLVCPLDGKECLLEEYQCDIHWLSWAEKHFENMQILSAYPLQTTEILKENAAALSPYLKYLRNTFFSSFAPLEGLGEYQTTLLRLSERLSLENSAGEALPLESIPQFSPINASHAPKVPAPLGGNFEFTGQQTNLAVVPLGAEYAALLSVCAIKTWISPHLLAEVVRKLEAGLVDAEYHAAYAIDNVARQEVAVMEKYATKLR